MTQEIITQRDMPTHKLTVKKEDGTYRQFYLNQKQAEWMAKNINSVEPFIVLPKDVDPNSPQFYPKRGADMEKLSEDDLDRLRRKYQNSTQAREVRDEEEERKKHENTEAVRQWMSDNPKEFEKLLDEATKNLTSRKGIFHSASKNVKKTLIMFEAMRYVSERHVKQP